MEKWHYLLIAIGIIILLVVLFFIGYYFNKKTPVPKGCEHLLKNDENCTACSNFDCDFKIKSKENEEENSLKEDK